MKGTIFQRPLEFRVEINGESWHQGDTVSGTLTVRNHGNETANLADVRVYLAHAALAKVHKKDPAAYKMIGNVAFDAAATVPAAGEATLDWSFATDRNCPITDGRASLFLVYGKGDAQPLLGQLELPIHPYPLIGEFLKAFQIQNRFVLKAQRASKGRVELKLNPPDSKAFSTLDHVLVSFKFDGDALEVDYYFEVKNLETENASIDIKKKARELSQRFEKTQYTTSSGRVNHAHIEAAIKEALGAVEGKLMF
ncbi:MAG: hypothetical protein HY075_14215 [Deltaproteobacteria bacterium]|nr:hypothetical protein [Deltaproteobacteria bacterium]